MEIILIIIAAFGLFWLEKRIYRKHWRDGLNCRAFFQEHPATEGDEVEMTHIVENRKRLPLPALSCAISLSANGHIARTGESRLKETFSLRGKSRIKRRIRLGSLKRGMYTISSEDMTAYDMLLSEKFTGSADTPSVLYVYPKPVRTAQFAPVFTKLEESFWTRSFSQEDPYAFKGLREYTERDPFRSVNWFASARNDELLVNVREFTAYLEVTVILLFEDVTGADVSASHENEIRIALSFAEQCFARGFAVSVVSNGRDCADGRECSLPFMSGSAGGIRVRQALTRLYPEFGLGSGDELISRELAKARRGRYCVLVTADASEKTARGFSSLCMACGGGLWLSQAGNDIPAGNGYERLYAEV